jgi:hypothetical protein
MATIFDVIDNFWGPDPFKAIGNAESKQLSEFGYEVRKFYQNYESPEPKSGELRTYHGDIAAIHYALGGVHLKGLSLAFATNLLYAHKTIAPDPIALWYFEKFEQIAAPPATTYFNRVLADQSEVMIWALQSHLALQFDRDVCRELLAYFVRGLLSIRELVEAGIVILISQPDELIKSSKDVLQIALRDAVSKPFINECGLDNTDLPMWDSLRGGPFTADIGGGPPDPSVIAWAKAKEASYHLNKHLFVGKTTGSVFVPTNDMDIKLLHLSLQHSADTLQVSSVQEQTAVAVIKLQVPSLRDISPADVMSIRRNEDAFEEFRLILQRKLFSVDSQREAFIEQSSAELVSELKAIARKTSAKNIIKKFLVEDGLQILSKAIIGASVGSVAGHAVLGGALPILHQLQKSFRSSASSHNPVLVRLAGFKNTSQQATPESQKEYARRLPKALQRVPLGRLAVGPNVPELVNRNFGARALWEHASKILYEK